MTTSFDKSFERAKAAAGPRKKFSDVWVGQIFHFDHSDLSLSSRLSIAQGPWLKTGKRKYVQFYEGRPSSRAFYGEHTVGSSSTEVDQIADPKSYYWIAFDKKGRSINYAHGYKPGAKDLSSSDPMLTSGVEVDVVQMFSGAAHVSEKAKPHVEVNYTQAKYVTIYAEGAAELGVPIKTYQRATAGGHWRKNVFSPQHGLK